MMEMKFINETEYLANAGKPLRYNLTPTGGLSHIGYGFWHADRAHLTQEKALLKTLKSKRINAILDVFHVEPLPEDSPYYELDNVILTPHNAGYTGRDRFIPFLFEEFKNFFSGTKIQSNISKSRFLTMTNESLKCSA